MGQFMESKKKEWAFTAEKLGSQVICERCGATYATFADQCDAALDDPCPGFVMIDKVKDEFHRRKG
jgi:hypothetical protein